MTLVFGVANSADTQVWESVRPKRVADLIPEKYNNLYAYSATMCTA